MASLLPGVGHLIVGRRRAGMTLLLATIALVVGLGATLLTLDASATERLAVRTDVLLAIAAGLVLAGVLWCAAILSAYRAARPPRMSGSQAAVTRGLVGLTCLAVMTPLTYGASTVYAARDVLSEKFRSDLLQAAGDPAVAGVDLSTPTPTPTPVPFADRDRVSVLLLGGDGEDDRRGVRTDALILATVDTRTGRTSLISLPRNLQNIPLRPGTPLANAYPNGFPEFWFSLYTVAADNPALMPHVRPENAGAAAITDAAAYLTGIDIDYYALTDMAGFRKIVNSLGGVTMNVRSGDGLPIPIGGSHAGDGTVTARPHGEIALGPQKLDGYSALWYARSRFASGDEERQARQRCLLTAIARQADPGSLLTSIREFTSAAKQILLTNIPAEVLPDFAELARQYRRTAQIDRVTILDVVSSSVNPDVEAIRARAAAAVAGSLTPEATSDYGVLRPICPNL
ncbi:LCP family protein [Sporichthya polymorpha]|uniref:LCP family protein n=1 Tax=Sporichthya polymorpha TaxID=35751 RepID=UPI00146B8FE5|nr:LCP family protein [Sporichthya polymorpha]